MRLAPPSIRRYRPIAAALLLCAACRSDDIFTSMSDSTFVHTMIALRRLPVGADASTPARTAMRDSVLRTFGVTAADVESTAVRLARDPVRAAGIWRAIEATPSGPP